MRALSLVVVALSLGAALTACPPPPVCTPGSPASRDAVLVLAPGLVPYLTGQEARVIVPLDSSTPCEDPEAPIRPSAAIVRVEDPANQVVPGTAGILNRSEVELLFVPPVPGWYHLTVTVDPSLGTYQRDVLVLEDHSGDAYEELPGACNQVVRTASGALLCDRTLYRDGGVAQTLPPTPSPPGRWAAATDVVWEVSARGAQRWIDRGAGPLVPEPALVLSGSDAGTDLSRLIARRDEVLAVINDDLYRFTTDGGVPALANRLYAGPLSGAPVHLHWLDGGVLVSTGASNPFGTPRSLGQSCAKRLDGGAMRATDAGVCTVLDGVPVGADEDTLWIFDDTSAALQAYAVLPDGDLTPGARLAFPSSTVFAVTPVSAPFELGRPGPHTGALVLQTFQSPPTVPIAVPRVEGGNVVLECYQPNARDFRFGDATDGLVWIVGRSLPEGLDRTRVFTR